MASFSNKNGVIITLDLIDIINANKQYLSDLDGLIGDGDHGINMSKGFSKAKKLIDETQDNLSSSLKILGTILIDEIGGSMGPIYGSMFLAFARNSKKHELIDEKVFSEMINNGLEKIVSLGEAKVGDKTLVDTITPAVRAFDEVIAKGESFATALEMMKIAAEKGRDSTKDMVAKKGRASRLGERSKGVLDTGAVSCCLILTSISESMNKML
ncbi:MAG: dihydroxyacetone kinase subunit L [Phycisphaerae bacterium]|nr:dihydroxyacetone kinase subunit L [Phycisphaerae bacterium]